MCWAHAHQQGMGKVKHERKKLHNPAPTAAAEAALLEAVKLPEIPSESGFTFSLPSKATAKTPKPTQGSKEDPLEAVSKVDLAKIKREVTASTSSIPAKKDERRKLRHDKFLEKLAFAKKQRQDEAKPQKKINAMEFEELISALPAPKLTSNPFAKKTFVVGNKTKGRNQILMQEMMQFKSVLANRSFKKAPIETIAEHLKNSVAEE